MERMQISERVQSAMDHKKGKGERISGKPPYGYRFEDDKVVEDETEQATIRKIKMLSDGGHSIRKISEALAAVNVFNREGKPFGVHAIHNIKRSA